MNEGEIHKTLGLILGKLDGIYHQLASSHNRHEEAEKRLASVEKKVYIGTGIAMAFSAFLSQFKSFFH